jgi:glycosyltransferase involved in cell wall biosynthesis
VRILFLCEGNAETSDSWSGVSLSVVEHLRSLGHDVVTGDVDVYGWHRARVALSTFALGRRRWWVRYHLLGPGFRARSARAARLLLRHGDGVDIVFQVGATFRVPHARAPLVMYCDSNIELSARAASTGFSEAAALTANEIAEIRAREAEVYRSASLVFTMSEMLRRSFITDFGLDGDRLVTVHCAPNMPLPEVGPPGRSASPPRVLFVGRDYGRKGGALLLEAFAIVRQRIPEARLLMVGCEVPRPRPPWLDLLEYQSRDTEAGRLAMDRAYRESTVFCLPTRFEPFGTSFVEAMGYGLPCVGPRAWAVPEIIVHGETGYLVDPGDPVALADALVRLLGDPALARRLGRAGRERVLERFTWPAIAERMSQAMGELLDGIRPRYEGTR